VEGKAGFDRKAWEGSSTGGLDYKHFSFLKTIPQEQFRNECRIRITFENYSRLEFKSNFNSISSYSRKNESLNSERK